METTSKMRITFERAGTVTMYTVSPWAVTHPNGKPSHAAHPGNPEP